MMMLKHNQHFKKPNKRQPLRCVSAEPGPLGSFPPSVGSFLACCRLKKIGISIFRPQTDVPDKENVSKNTKAMCHSSFLTDRRKR